MELNSIVLELMTRIQVLEKKVEQLERQVNAGAQEPRPFPGEEISRKYLPLAEYLFRNQERKAVLSYRNIEEILGFALPGTAYQFPQSFWANTKTHSYSSAWMRVGYRAKVNAEEKIVTFEKTVLE